ncbi:MAG: ammonium transporter, partial [Treponema sp.]|nr:ammonium transporter [Treponema sp.]
MQKKFLVLMILFLCAGISLFAQEGTEPDALGFSVDIVWMFLGAILVFIFQAGFALVETGLTRA